MKIRAISVKNVKSFKEECSLEFDDGLNILIGPNGGGKSNLLTIMTVVLNHFFLYRYTWRMKADEAGKQAEEVEPNILFGNVATELDKYIGDDSDSLIALTIESEVTDFENMRVLAERKADLQARLDSSFNPRQLDYPENWHEAFSESVQLRYEIVNNKLQAVAPESAEGLYLKYLREYTFFRQLCEDIEGIELFSPTVFFPPSRSLGGALQIEIQQLKTVDYYNQLSNLSQIQSRSGGQSMAQIAVIHFSRKLRKYEIRAARVRDAVVNELFEADEDVVLLSKYLRQIGYGWAIIEDEAFSRYTFNFTKSGRPFDLNKASSGEQELLNFLLGIFSLNVNGGIVFVDEPEIHLHPRWQSVLLDIFRDLSRQKRDQFIISTHSPVFVTAETIDSVYRIHQRDNISRQISLRGQELPKKHELARTINSHNNERLFFSDTVILVEGIKDRLVFERLVEHLAKKYEIRRAVEVLEVFGKNNFPEYESLLKSLDVDYLVVADLDFLEEVGDEHAKSLFSYVPAAVDRNVLNDKKSKDRRTLIELLEEAICAQDFSKVQQFINYLINRFKRLKSPLSWQEKKATLQLLSSLRSSGLYILSRGEIESYVPKGTRATEEFISVLSDPEWYLKDVEYNRVRELLQISGSALKLNQEQLSGLLREARHSIAVASQDT